MPRLLARIPQWFSYKNKKKTFASGYDTYTKPTDPDVVHAQKAIKDKNWDTAIELLEKAAARDPKNADIHNLMGFTERSRGNLDAAFKHYEQALALNPSIAALTSI